MSERRAVVASFLLVSAVETLEQTRLLPPVKILTWYQRPKLLMLSIPDCDCSQSTLAGSIAG